MKRIVFFIIASGMLAGCATDPFLKGLILRDEHQYEQALSAFQQVQENHRLFPRTRKEIEELQELIRMEKAGEKAFSAKNYQTARTIYEKILRVDPGNPEAKERLVFIRDRTNKKASAEARSLSNEHVQRGIKHRESGEVLPACIEFRQARELFPDHPEATKLLEAINPAVAEALARNLESAREQINNRQPEESLALLETNLKCKPQDEASLKLYLDTLRKLGVEAYSRSDYQKAIDYFERELHFSPEDPTIKGYLEKARKLLRELKKR